LRKAYEIMGGETFAANVSHMIYTLIPHSYYDLKKKKIEKP
jgi:hypothetical protein